MTNEEDKQRIISLVAKATVDPNFAQKLLNTSQRADALTERRKKGQPKWGLHSRIVSALLGLPSFNTPEDFLEAATKVIDNVGKLD